MYLTKRINKDYRVSFPTHINHVIGTAHTGTVLPYSSMSLFYHSD
jgi:hypothetical protein